MPSFCNICSSRMFSIMMTVEIDLSVNRPNICLFVGDISEIMLGWKFGITT